jgi:hypothetical protein
MAIGKARRRQVSMGVLIFKSDGKAVVTTDAGELCDVTALTLQKLLNDPEVGSEFSRTRFDLFIKRVKA